MFLIRSCCAFFCPALKALLSMPSRARGQESTPKVKLEAGRISANKDFGEQSMDIGAPCYTFSSTHVAVMLTVASS